MLVIWLVMLLYCFKSFLAVQQGPNADARSLSHVQHLELETGLMLTDGWLSVFLSGVVSVPKAKNRLRISISSAGGKTVLNDGKFVMGASRFLGRVCCFSFGVKSMVK